MTLGLIQVWLHFPGFGLRGWSGKWCIRWVRSTRNACCFLPPAVTGAFLCHIQAWDNIQLWRFHECAFLTFCLVFMLQVNWSVSLLWQLSWCVVDFATTRVKECLNVCTIPTTGFLMCCMYSHSEYPQSFKALGYAVSSHGMNPEGGWGLMTPFEFYDGALNVAKNIVVLGK